MDLIEKYIEEIKNISIDNDPIHVKEHGISTIDVRVSFSRKGVKVHIRYASHSKPQKKPYPTLKEAFKAALKSYLYYIDNDINYNQKNKEIYTGDNKRLLAAETISIKYLKLL